MLLVDSRFIKFSLVFEVIEILSFIEAGIRIIFNIKWVFYLYDLPRRRNSHLKQHVPTLSCAFKFVIC